MIPVTSRVSLLKSQTQCSDYQDTKDCVKSQRSQHKLKHFSSDSLIAWQPKCVFFYSFLVEETPKLIFEWNKFWKSDLWAIKFSSKGEMSPTDKQLNLPLLLCFVLLYSTMDVHLRYPPRTQHTHKQTNRAQTHRAFIGNRGCGAQLKTATSHQFNCTNTHRESQKLENDNRIWIFPDFTSHANWFWRMRTFLACLCGEGCQIISRAEAAGFRPGPEVRRLPHSPTEECKHVKFSLKSIAWRPWTPEPNEVNSVYSESLSYIQTVTPALRKHTHA